MVDYRVPTVPKRPSEAQERVAWLKANLQALDGIHDGVLWYPAIDGGESLLADHLAGCLAQSMATIRSMVRVVESEG
jgi:hypothetical protein